MRIECSDKLEDKASWRMLKRNEMTKTEQECMNKKDLSLLVERTASTRSN